MIITIIENKITMIKIITKQKSNNNNINNNNTYSWVTNIFFKRTNQRIDGRSYSHRNNYNNNNHKNYNNVNNYNNNNNNNSSNKKIIKELDDVNFTTNYYLQQQQNQQK